MITQYIYLSMYVHVCMYVCMNDPRVYVCACMYVCIYVYSMKIDILKECFCMYSMYVCIYECMY